MKNVFKLIGIIALVAVMAFALVFTACGDGGGNGKDDKTDDDGSTGTGGPGTNVQNASVYNENNTLFTGSGKVFLEYFGENDYVGVKEVGSITNGKLSFILPDLSANVANGYLAADAFDWGGSGGINASFPDARVLITDTIDNGSLYALLDNGDHGMLVYGNEGSNSSQWIEYAYLDKPTTVSGTSSYDYYGHYYTTKVNCTFTKGWNVVYIHEDSYTGTVSTNSSIVNTAKMKWYLFMD